jgi:hypothetical protein
LVEEVAHQGAEVTSNADLVPVFVLFCFMCSSVTRGALGLADVANFNHCFSHD